MMSDKIMIHSDEWRDLNTIYTVISYARRDPESTAVELVIETADGSQETRVVPVQWISWIYGE